MALPAVRIEENLELIAHVGLGDYPNVGEGMAMKIADDGRRYLYVANERQPGAYSIVDVTDPASPNVLAQFPVEHDAVRANSLAVNGDILLVARQTDEFDADPAGFFVYDISTPDQPKEISFFDTSGPHSKGVHRVSIMDGRYVHMTSGAADFEPKHPKDHQFYMIVDLVDPANPVEVGRWWVPGQRKGDPEDYVRHTEHDFGFRLHHAMVYPQRPDRAYLGYIDAGLIILDISDKAAPKMLSRLDYHPPLPGFTHTPVPLFDRGIMLVSDEATGDEGTDWPKRYWIMDIREETNPVMISTFPVPDGFDELHRVGGRIGAHNLHENEPLPGSAYLENTAVATWFSAGLRVYDIRDPFTPKEIGAFLPETPEGQRGCRISDVFVDDRKVIYAGDRARGGLYILTYDGPIPLD